VIVFVMSFNPWHMSMFMFVLMCVGYSRVFMFMFMHLISMHVLVCVPHRRMGMFMHVFHLFDHYGPPLHEGSLPFVGAFPIKLYLFFPLLSKR
jgi:hypothetical protein